MMVLTDTWGLWALWTLSSLSSLLEYERHAIMHGELWRLWTGHLVHWSAQHALLDLAACLVAGWIAVQHHGARRIGCALLLGAPCISIGLLVCAPALHGYRGASGIAVLLTVLALAGLWRQARGATGLRTLLAAMALALAAKIVAEACGAGLGWSDLPPDVAVAWQAHLLGALAGAIAVVRIRRWPRAAA